jgi:hypothetical protein
MDINNMSSLTGFVDAMLRLRSQRLDEELAEEKMRRQDYAALGQGIGNFLGTVGEGLEQSRRDAIANSLLNEMAPRAQAVDPSAQGPADAVAATMPGFGTRRRGRAEDAFRDS